MKILVLDIETSPHVVYRFDKISRPATASLDSIIEPSRVLCVAYRWLGEDATPKVACEWDNYKRGLTGQQGMLHEVHAMLDEADVVVHYNGKSFDVPHLNRAFIEAGLMPPSPFRQVDLYHTVRSKFALPSNRLKYVAEWLGVEEKVESGGLKLWRRVLEGSGADQKAAQRTMRDYCAQDVVVTDHVYQALLPMIPNLPNAGLYADEEQFFPTCPGCGSANVEKNGHAYTNAGKFQRYRCRDCGRHSRGTQRVATTELRPL